MVFQAKLYKPIDNASLIVFRMLFGFLMFWQIGYDFFSGFITRNFVKVKFTFSHIGMDWLQPLPGNGMYWYFGVMGILALMVSVGYKYRFAIIFLTLFWAGSYFMQKTIYNNHHYLILLICFIMCFLPARNYASVDTKINPSIKRLSMPYWCSIVMILQMAIVYLYASVAKLYGGWMDGTFSKVMLGKNAPEFIGGIYSNPLFHLFIAYAGIAFDLLIIPMLLWKRTRNLALLLSVFFHLFNSIHLRIGIFPFLALGFILFFYEPETIRKRFLWRKPEMITENYEPGKSILTYIFIPYFIVQLLLPLRHHLIKGDVLWTEEGHRLSWRMMLRSRTGTTVFKVVDNKTNDTIKHQLSKDLTKTQIKKMRTKPDMIWQTAQMIKKKYVKKGKDVRVYADSKIAINRGEERQLINPNVDLAHAEWDYFWHNDWILLYDENGKVIVN